MTLSLSCATAPPPIPIKDDASAAASTGRFENGLTYPPCDVARRTRQPQSEQTISRRRQSNTLEISSPSRDRDFDVSFKPGARPQTLIPSFQVPQWRALDRKSVPAVDHGS